MARRESGWAQICTYPLTRFRRGSEGNACSVSKQVHSEGRDRRNSSFPAARALLYANPMLNTTWLKRGWGICLLAACPFLAAAPGAWTDPAVPAGSPVVSPAFPPAATILAANKASESLPQPDRVRQAKELLGSRYEHSAAKEGEKVPDLLDFVRRCARGSLHRRWRKDADRIAISIMEESRRRRFDPVFLMSVIDNESRWRPEARGRHGEIGLMQIKPTTARWISRLYSIPFHGRGTLRDPAMNIRIGAAYLSFLREEFNSRGILYVSAYNAGVGTVYRALRRRRIPSRDYVARIVKQYLRYYSALKQEQALVREA